MASSSALRRLVGSFVPASSLLEEPAFRPSSSEISPKKRGRDDESNMASDEDVIYQGRPKKKQKQSKIVSRHRNCAAASSNSPVSIAKLQQRKPSKVEPSSDLGPESHEADSSVPYMSYGTKYLRDSLIKTQRQVAALTEQINTKREQHDEEKMKIKQNMMLDIISERERYEKKVHVLQREKHYLSEFGKEQTRDLEKWKTKCGEKDTMYAKVVSELNRWKQEADHYVELNRVLEADLDELRQIENEDAAQRRQKTQDLPPAYGSLDDEVNVPPVQVHKDVGSFDVATFKRTIRSDFQDKLHDSLKLSEEYRSSLDANQRAIANSLIFVNASHALAEASRSLKAHMHYAEDAVATHLVSFGHKDLTADAEIDPVPRQEAKRYAARRDYVADRAAKMIIDLCWRVASANEAWPRPFTLTATQKARLSLVYKEVDECFVEALRRAFTSSHQNLIFEYQHYITQISAVGEQLRDLGTGVNYNFFNKSLEWLQAQLESERLNEPPVRLGPYEMRVLAETIIAQARNNQVQGLPADDPALAERIRIATMEERRPVESEVSSEMGRTNSDSSDH